MGDKKKICGRINEFNKFKKKKKTEIQETDCSNIFQKFGSALKVH